MKIMMFNHNGSLNHGCEAIAETTSKNIKKYISDCEITLLSGNPSSDMGLRYIDKIIDSNSINYDINALDKVIAFTQLKLKHSESYILKKMYANTIKEAKNNDICLSIGGDTYCYGEQSWLYEVDKCIKKQGKNLVLWGCSIGEEDLSKEKLEDLSNMDMIICRESLTYEVLKKHGLNNAKLFADPAFLLEKEELPLLKGWKSGKTVGINLSPLIFKKNDKLLNICDEFIKYLIDNTEYQIVLTPHVMEIDNNDYDLLKQYYNKYKSTNRVLLLSDNLTAAQYKGYIGRMNYFIGARTHATIAAYSSLVPTLVLGYSIKSRGISKDIFGKESYVLDSMKLKDKNEIINEFNALVNDEGKIKKIMNKQIPEIISLSEQAFVSLRNLS